MRFRRLTVPALAGIIVMMSGASPQETKPQTPHSEFDGEILPVLYVADVQASVVYYADVLGFRFAHYYDHHRGESVTEWPHDDKPLYAEMWAGPTRFALHLADDEYEETVGGSIHYFGVRDVETHHRAVQERLGKPSEIVDRPWMKMFSIIDPDGHRLYFQTRPPVD